MHLLFRSLEQVGGFEIQTGVCRKLHSELPQGVVEAGLHGPHGDLDDLLQYLSTLRRTDADRR